MLHHTQGAEEMVGSFSSTQQVNNSLQNTIAHTIPYTCGTHPLATNVKPTLKIRHIQHKILYNQFCYDNYISILLQDFATSHLSPFSSKLHQGRVVLTLQGTYMYVRTSGIVCVQLFTPDVLRKHSKRGALQGRQG